LIQLDALAEKLDAWLREWRPETAAEARQCIAEVIELADADLLEVARSRAVEQQVCSESAAVQLHTGFKDYK